MQEPKIRIEGVDQPQHVGPGVMQCVFGRDLIIDPEVLSKYVFSELPARAHDLIIIAGIVAFADRVVRRRTSVGWKRNFELLVPVHEPGFWRQAQTLKSLNRALDLVTGDYWSFEFQHRRALTKVSAQAPPLALKYGTPPIVMAHSDGLDSFAVARLTSSREPEVPLILVTTGRRNDADGDWRDRHLNATRNRVSVPFKISDHHSDCRFREPSYRSRAFAFFVMAGIAAHLAGGERVIVAESGQGGLGPWLVPVGNEAPDIRMHPVFTRSLESFLSLVFDNRIRYEHPQLWHSKGETLAQLANLHLEEDWEKTRSCARDARHISLAGNLIQCGVCSACLLRRQSLYAAGLEEVKDRYLWQNLRASSLAAAAVPGARETSLEDERQAACGLLSLVQLADLGNGTDSTNRIQDAAFDLAQVTGEPQAIIKSKLLRLLKVHRDELTGFISSQGKNAFLLRWWREIKS